MQRSVLPRCAVRRAHAQPRAEQVPVHRPYTRADSASPPELLRAEVEQAAKQLPLGSPRKESSVPPQEPAAGPAWRTRKNLVRIFQPRRAVRLHRRRPFRSSRSRSRIRGTLAPPPSSSRDKKRRYPKRAGRPGRGWRSCSRGVCLCGSRGSSSQLGGGP